MMKFMGAFKSSGAFYILNSAGFLLVKAAERDSWARVETLSKISLFALQSCLPHSRVFRKKSSRFLKENTCRSQ